MIPYQYYFLYTHPPTYSSIVVSGSSRDRSSASLVRYVDVKRVQRDVVLQGRAAAQRERGHQGDHFRGWEELHVHQASLQLRHSPRRESAHSCLLFVERGAVVVVVVVGGRVSSLAHTSSISHSPLAKGGISVMCCALVCISHSGVKQNTQN